MSEIKTYKSSLFKRIIDLGKVDVADVDDLVRIWRVGSGDEKAITLANFVATVDADLGSGGSSLTELINDLTTLVNSLPQGAGAGLSIDGDGNVQLGNDGAGLVNTQAFEVEDGDGFRSELEFGTNRNLFSGTTFLVSKISENYEYIDIDNLSNIVLDIRASLDVPLPDYRRESRIRVESEIESTTGNGLSEIDLYVNKHGSRKGILISDENGFIARDEINSKGIEYEGDYESNFTARSLVTKQYVDSGIGSATFIGLTDTPASYTGQAWLFPRVNSGESALEFFNPLSLPLTSYTVGSNTALADTDTILGAFGKVQGQINAKIGGTIASGQVAFGTGTGTIGGSTVFVRSANGRIGVGVTNPDLYSFNTNTAGWLVVGDPTAFGGISIASSNTSQGYLAFADGSSGGDRFVGEIRYDHAANEMYFRTNGTFAGFIASNGRWLIGPTATPTNTLDVNGTARIRTLSNATGDFVTASATGVLQKRTASETLADIGGIGGTIASGQVAFGTGTGTIGGENALWWDSTNDRLGIGTTSPQTGFELRQPRAVLRISDSIDASATNQQGSILQFWSNDASVASGSSGQRVRAEIATKYLNAIGNINSLSFYVNDGTNTAPVERWQIDHQGWFTSLGSTERIGINTTAPTNTLDVNGSARIRTINNLGYTATEFLTQDPLGVVSKRTASETLADIGGIGGTIASGQVAFGTGTGTIGGDSGLTWDNVNKVFTHIGLTSRFQNILNQQSLEIVAGSVNTIQSFNRTSLTFQPLRYRGIDHRWDNGSGTISMYLSSGNLLGLLTASPTNTLDVNGTARIRTLSNATGDFVTASATGVLQKRTASETLADIGGIGGTISSGQVAFGTGTGTIGGEDLLRWSTVQKTLFVGSNDFATNSVLNITESASRIYALNLVNRNSNKSYIFGVDTVSVDDGWFQLRDNTLNAVRMAVTSGGNLLINRLTDQGSKVQVDGTIYSNGNSYTGLQVNYTTGFGLIQLTRNNSRRLYLGSSVGADTVVQFGAVGDDGVERPISIQRATGNTGILTTSPTNTLDVNGTARIRTISNATGNFLTTSATGVIQQRTASETLADIGGIGGTIASGQVAFGTGSNTIGGDSGLTWDNVNKRLGFAANPATKLWLGSTFNTNYLTLRSDATNATGFYGLGAFNSGAVFGVGIWSATGSSLPSAVDPDFIITSGKLTGIRTTSPTNTLDVNGTARIRTLSNATGDFVTASATGVLQKRTASEVASDIGAVTITGTQTITGEKTFSNSLLIQEASAPILRLKTTAETQATVNFRNSANEDEAGLQFDAGVGKFSLLTRTNNCDIEIAPHGTGSILLPNVPSGSGDVLMLNGSGEVVKGSGTTQSTGTFTPTLTESSGGITYTFTVTNANYVKIGKIVYFSITLSSISSSGSGGGELRVGNLPFSASTGTGKFWFIGITAISGSSFSKDALLDLRGIIAQTNSYASINGVWSSWTAPTFTSGTISISGFYETDS